MKPFEDSDFNIGNIVLACHVGKGLGARTHHDRPSHGLALHISGRRRYIFQTGDVLTVAPYDLIYLPKGSDYEVLTEEPGECYAVNFEISSEETYAPFVCRVKNASGMLDLFKNAKTSWETKKEGYLLKCKADLYSIIYLMTEERSLQYTSKDKRELILPAVSCIHENYMRENLSIAALSAACSITPEYFRSIFKGIYGVSPKSYITGLKIERAKELLASGMYSVTDTALLSGYSDLSHFSREFKKATGEAPGNYRRT